MGDTSRHLPVVQDPADAGEPSCSPKIYVSNEEAALLAEMRRLREASVELRKKLDGAGPEERQDLQSRIDEMRGTWKELAAQREKAFVRKMIMLGHLPPEADRDSSL